MRQLRRLFLFGLCAAYGLVPGNSSAKEISSIRNRAIGHFQNEDFGKARKAFEKASESSSGAVEDRFNWALAAFREGDHEAAISILKNDAKKIEHRVAVNYLLGVAFARIGKYSEAESALERVVDADPLSAEAYYNLGKAQQRIDKVGDAVKSWRRTIQLNPMHTPAYFSLFRYHMKKGETEKADWAFEKYQATKKEEGGSGWSLDDVERSRYTKLLPYSSSPLRLNALPEVVFKEHLLERIPKSFKTAVLGDFDDDTDLDLCLDGGCIENKKGRFAWKGGPVKPETARGLHATGDFNGDGHLDIVLSTQDTLSLREGQEGLFFGEEVDIKKRVCGKGIPVVGLEVVDLDHEGDLDLLVFCGASKDSKSIRVFRNNGNMTFTDVTQGTGIHTSDVPAKMIVLSDFDGGNDVDLLVFERNGRAKLFFNQRDGSFLEKNLDGSFPYRSVQKGDVNGDGLTDFVGLRRDGSVEVWRGDGRGEFFIDPTSLPPVLGVRGLRLVDIENDGDLDLVAFGDRALQLRRNDNHGHWSHVELKWQDTSSRGKHLSRIETADFDLDGDQDFLVFQRDGSLSFVENKTKSKNRALRFRLLGRKNNTDGVGSKVIVRDGSFLVYREVENRWINIGVGERKSIETLSVQWPTGVRQAEFDVKAGKSPVNQVLTERPGLAESCPFVYAYNGETFEFITDFLDPTPLGVSLQPDVLFEPNSRESVLIEGTRLRPRDGLLSLRVTQELEEITYLDEIRLSVIDHPKDLRVLPNDRFSLKPFAKEETHLFEAFDPEESLNLQGETVEPALARADRHYAYDAPPLDERYPGVTRPHGLILSSGPLDKERDLWLLLRGTTLWTEASVNVAISQNDDVNLFPVQVDIREKGGAWRRILEDAGVPAGVDKFLPIHLSPFLRNQPIDVRIRTNMAILWDEAFFGYKLLLDEDGELSNVTQLKPLRANLRHRGFSKITSPDGKLPDLYDYDVLEGVDPYRVVHRGYYTRYGEVTSLLQKSDDLYVILAPGDEVAIEFPAIELESLKSGWTRDYVFHAKGWIKDGDLRTETGEQVAPLPFWGMTTYPYRAPETYPEDSKHREYLGRYQTRFLPGDGVDDGSW